MRIPAHLQRDIARLHFHAPQSSRAISRITGVSPNSVTKLRIAIARSGKIWSELSELDDDEWQKALYPGQYTAVRRKAEPDWALIHQEMLRPDATREQLWQEWRMLHPTGIGYSQFTAGYRRWLGVQRLVMRQVHRPGDKMFADFAGRKIEIRGSLGEEPLYAQLFVAVMGCSNYTYLEAVWQQSTECWVQAQANAFEFFGGSPNWVISDNLKAAVWRRERDRIVINPTYRECLKHYETAPLPTKPRTPKQNAKAEAGVQIAQRWVLFALRDRVFFSLEEANAEIRRLNEALNNRPFKKMDGCRRSRFEKLDAPALRPLPAVRYEVADWRYGVRVGDDYLVEHAKCFYSVPWQYRGDLVDLRHSINSIEIFRRNRRVATHALLKIQGEISRLDAHMPAAHIRVLEGEPRTLMSWAQSVGGQTEKMFTHHLTERHDLTNGVKAARKMRELARLHGNERFEAVCAYALGLNITALRSIESILKKNADLRARQSLSPDPVLARPTHPDVRGANYFGGA